MREKVNDEINTKTAARGRRLVGEKGEGGLLAQGSQKYHCLLGFLLSPMKSQLLR